MKHFYLFLCVYSSLYENFVIILSKFHFHFVCYNYTVAKIRLLLKNSLNSQYYGIFELFRKVWLYVIVFEGCRFEYNSYEKGQITHLSCNSDKR